MRSVRSRPFVGWISALVLLAACGEDPLSMTEPDPDPPPVQGEGLLEGDPASPAVDGARSVGPIPAPTSEIDAGFFRTRLRAVLAPAGTVQDVNAALELHGARIVSMRRGHHAVTLAVPDQPSPDAAQALADELAATPGFVFVRPAFELGAQATRSAPMAMDLPPSGTDALDHWALMRMPAAWNAAALAVTNAERIGTLVPDAYGTLTPHPQIASQSFTGNGTATTEAGDHGFMVSGLIGAKYDDQPVTGASPRPQDLVGITSIPLGGLASWSDVFFEIRDQLPPSGRVVLNTSIGPERLGPNREADELHKDELIDRALDALFWRDVFAQDYGRFLHVGAAGNDADVSPGTASDVRYDAAWFVSARWDDPYELIPQEMLTDQERLDLEAIFASYYDNEPGTQSRSPNVLAVGGSDATGQRLAMSNRNEDVRTIGASVPSTCVSTASTCVGGITTATGTSLSAAMVSGIAAYLWNLSPTMPVAELRDRLVAGYQSGSLVPGLLDAYNLALGLDGGVDIVNARVRHTLLDVTGPGLDTPPNGVFDEEDIARFLTLFQSFETLRQDVPAQQWDADPDYSRYDLNGNGITHEHGDGEDLYDGPFDLDTGGQITSGVTQVIEGQTLAFDEPALTDQDILCYYAYSDLYAGDLTSRTNLLGDLCGNRLVVTIGVPFQLIEGVSEELVIRVGRPATEGTEWVEDAEVEITVENGEVSFGLGDTDAEGYFRTTLTGSMATGENTTIRVNATLGEYSGEATREVTLRPLLEIYGTNDGEPRLFASAQTRHVWEGQEFVELDTLTLGFATTSTTVSANRVQTYPCSASGSWTSDITSEVAVVQRVERSAGSVVYELEVDGRSIGDTDTSGGSSCGRPPVWPRVSGGAGQTAFFRAYGSGTYTITVTYESSNASMDGLSSVNLLDYNSGELQSGTDDTVTGSFDENDNFSLGASLAFQVYRTATHDYTSRMTVRVVLTAS